MSNPDWFAAPTTEEFFMFINNEKFTEVDETFIQLAIGAVVSNVSHQFGSFWKYAVCLLVADFIEQDYFDPANKIKSYTYEEDISVTYQEKTESIDSPYLQKYNKLKDRFIVHFYAICEGC